MKLFISKLIKLIEREKHPLIEYEELISPKFKMKSVDEADAKLKLLEGAEILNYEREEFGFRIEIINMEELKDINHTLEAIASVDDDIQRLISDIAFELKGKTKDEAIIIINSYKEKLASFNEGNG